MNKLIRWRIDHPEHPMIYETEEWRLEGDIEAIKWENNLSHANIIYIHDDIPTDTEPDNSLSPHKEPIPVPAATPKRKPRSKAS